MAIIGGIPHFQTYPYEVGEDIGGWVDLGHALGIKWWRNGRYPTEKTPFSYRMYLSVRDMSWQTFDIRGCRSNCWPPDFSQHSVWLRTPNQMNLILFETYCSCFTEGLPIASVDSTIQRVIVFGISSQFVSLEWVVMIYPKHCHRQTLLFGKPSHLLSRTDPHRWRCQRDAWLSWMVRLLQWETWWNKNRHKMSQVEATNELFTAECR